MSGDIVTGGNGMAGAGWHLAVTGGGGGGLQTSGTGGDGTVAAGVVKGSDGGLQTSDDGGQQVAVMMGGDGGQHAGRGDGAQAAANCHLLPLVTASRLLLSQYHLSPLIGSPLSPPVTTSSRLHHQPHGTAHHRFRLDGDGKLHTYRWSSVLLTAHRLASRLALEAFESLHGLRYVRTAKIYKLLHTKFREFQFMDVILWTKIRGIRFWGQRNGDEVLQTNICGQILTDEALWMKTTNLVRISGLCGEDRRGFLAFVVRTVRIFASGWCESSGPVPYFAVWTVGRL